MKKSIKTLYAAYRQDPADVSIWYGKLACPEFYNGYKGLTMEEVFETVNAVARSIGHAVANEGMTLPEPTPFKELKKQYKGQSVTLSQINIDTKTGATTQTLLA